VADECSGDDVDSDPKAIGKLPFVLPSGYKPSYLMLEEGRCSVLVVEERASLSKKPECSIPRNHTKIIFIRWYEILPHQGISRVHVNNNIHTTRNTSIHGHIDLLRFQNLYFYAAKTPVFVGLATVQMFCYETLFIAILEPLHNHHSCPTIHSVIHKLSRR
jgi:hypothetical protein